ncbi:hypothetical protein EIJ81_01030 (plasmid) [Aliivibrio salmonicida]|nr:hypothetical protein EIJ81_01030 [Aliivibrio salmonicida]
MITLEKLELICSHIPTTANIKQALIFHLIDKLTIKEAEQKSGIATNSLKQKVARINKEIEYLQKMSDKNEIIEYQQKLF